MYSSWLIAPTFFDKSVAENLLMHNKYSYYFGGVLSVLQQIPVDSWLFSAKLRLISAFDSVWRRTCRCVLKAPYHWFQNTRLFSTWLGASKTHIFRYRYLYFSTCSMSHEAWDIDCQFWILGEIMNVTDWGRLTLFLFEIVLRFNKFYKEK